MKHELANVEVKQDPAAKGEGGGWCVYFDTTVTPQRVMVGNIADAGREGDRTHVYERYDKVDGLRYQVSKLKALCFDLRKTLDMTVPEFDRLSFEEMLVEFDERMNDAWGD